MSAFAELVAGFIGLVHELQPTRLRRIKKRKAVHHKSPFLFVSGYMMHTARGILETIEQRGFDVEIYHLERELPGGLKRHMKKAVAKRTLTEPQPDVATTRPPVPDLSPADIPF